MRLGELLVAGGTLPVEHVEEGLRAQVMWGGRLGTNLVELGYLDLDTLSRALGRQAGLPAALASHFQRADRPLQLMLTTDVAERFRCIPLLRAGTRVVIATADPLDAAGIALVADDLVIDPDRIVSSIAAELRIVFQLERLYGIPREQRFLRAKNVTSHSQLFQLPPTVDPAYDFAPPQPPPSRAPAIATSAIPDDSTLLLEEPAGDPAPEASAAERRTYLRTLADLLNQHPDRDSVMARVHKIAVGTDAIRPLKTHGPSLAFDASLLGTALGTTMGDAVDAICRAADREQLARLVIGTTARFVEQCRSALLLVVRGEAAVSWTGFCRDGTELPALAVPLDHPGLLPAAMRRKVTTRGTSGNLGPIDYLLLASLGLPYGDLVVAPIAIGEFVMSMVVIATERERVIEGTEAIGRAAGVAFSRLMRHAGRA